MTVELSPEKWLRGQSGGESPSESEAVKREPARKSKIQFWKSFPVSIQGKIIG